MPPGLPVPVLLLGEGNTALGALRAFGRRGIPCYLMPGATDFVRRSRWYRPWPGKGPSRPGALALVEWLESSPVEGAVLVPCADPWVMAVAELSGPLATRFPASVPPRAALGIFVDKGAFADRLTLQDLPHPRTVRVRTTADLRSIPEDLLSRAFLKPTDSYAFQLRFGRKAFRFSGVEEGERLAAEALAAGVEVMVQEYVQGPPSEHFFVDGFVDRTGEIRAAFARRRLRMWPPDFGDSSAMVSVPLEDTGPALSTLRALLPAVGYRGIFSAEFKRDPQDGLFKILEVNTRVWKYVDFAAACGVDVCSMAYRDALGLPVPTPGPYAVGSTCIDAYFDRLACLQLHRQGELSLSGWARSWLGARPVTFAWDDPLPGLSALVSLLPRLWSRSPGGRPR